MTTSENKRWNPIPASRYRTHVEMAGSTVHSSENFQRFGSSGIFLEDIILPFGSPKFVLSDNELKLDCKVVEVSARDQKIQWKHTATYNLRYNGIAERMVGTIKRVLQKMYRSNMLEWDLCLDHALYWYRRRSSADDKSPFEALYGFKA